MWATRRVVQGRWSGGWAPLSTARHFHGLVRGVGLMRVAALELGYELAVRGWDQRALAREAGISEATISRAMAGGRIRGVSGLKVAQALRRTPPVGELVALVESPSSRDRLEVA